MMVWVRSRTANLFLATHTAFSPDERFPSGAEMYRGWGLDLLKLFLYPYFTCTPNYILYILNYLHYCSCKIAVKVVLQFPDLQQLLKCDTDRFCKLVNIHYEVEHGTIEKC